MIRSRSFQLNNGSGNDDHSREIKSEIPRLKISVGADIHVLAKDREIFTDPEETRRRRAIRLVRSKANSWGFTLQTYGIRNKRTKEVEVMSYVDYVELNGPAWVAGMRRGDIILSVNGESVDAATHKELVNKIKSSGHELRLVVLFEDCCTKVELHERYLKLKKLLSGKLRELRQLEDEERRLNGGSPLSRLDSFRQSTTSSLCSDWDSYSLIASEGLDQIVANKFVSRTHYNDLSELSSAGSIPNHSISDVSIDSSVTDQSINNTPVKVADGDAIIKPFQETDLLTNSGQSPRLECVAEEIGQVNIHRKELTNVSYHSIPCQDNKLEAPITQFGCVEEMLLCSKCSSQSCCCFTHLSPEQVLDEQSLSEAWKQDDLHGPVTEMLHCDISRHKTSVIADFKDGAVGYDCVYSTSVSQDVENSCVSRGVNYLLNVDLCTSQRKNTTDPGVNNIVSAMDNLIVNPVPRKDKNHTIDKLQALLESRGHVHTVQLKSEEHTINSIVVEEEGVDKTLVFTSLSNMNNDQKETGSFQLYDSTINNLNSINDIPLGKVIQSSPITCDKAASIPPQHLVDGILVNDTTLSTRL